MIFTLHTSKACNKSTKIRISRDIPPSTLPPHSLVESCSSTSCDVHHLNISYAACLPCVNSYIVFYTPCSARDRLSSTHAIFGRASLVFWLIKRVFWTSRRARQRRGNENSKISLKNYQNGEFLQNVTVYLCLQGFSNLSFTRALKERAGTRSSFTHICVMCR